MMRVSLFVAQSLDGRITRHDEAGSGFASEEDRASFRSALAGCDAWILGGESYRQLRAQRGAGNPWRAGLRRIVWTRSPRRHATDAIPDLLEFTDAGPKAMIDHLAAKGHRHCALLGGARVYHAFLAARLVDEVVVTLEPRIFGTGLPLTIGGPLDVQLKLRDSQVLNPSGTLRLRYEVLGR